LVNENKGLDRAKDIANKYTNKAFKIIDRLPENPYKIILKEITEELLIRKY